MEGTVVGAPNALEKRGPFRVPEFDSLALRGFISLPSRGESVFTKD